MSFTYKKRRAPKHSSVGWASLLHRAATTFCLCCGQALEDSKGAGRTGLTRCKDTIFSLQPNVRQNKKCIFVIQAISMAEKNQTTDILQAAMVLGVWLAGYQIIKLALFVFTLKSQLLALPFFAMAAGVPFIACRLVRKFRDSNSMNIFPFITAWLLTLMTFLCATVLSGVVAFIYLNWFDHGFLVSALSEQISESLQIYQSAGNTASMQKMAEMMEDVQKMLDVMTPVAMTRQLITSALSWGNIFSLVIAILTARIRPVKKD